MNKRSLALATIPILLFIGACSKQPPSAMSTLPVAAYSPAGADLALLLDFQALRNSEFGKQSLQQRADLEKSDPVEQQKAARRNRFLQITGLQEADILGMLIAADLDSIRTSTNKAGTKTPALPDFQNQPDPITAGSEALAGMQGLMTVRLARPLTPDTLKAGLLALVEDRGGQVITKTSGATPILTFTVSSTNQTRSFCALADRGTTILLSPNEQVLLDQLAEKNKSAPSPLADSMKTVPASSTIRLSFLTSETMKKKLAETAATTSTKPANPMAASIARNFTNLTSIVAGISITSNINVNAACDLGSEQDSQATHTLLNNLLLPLLSLGAMQSGGASPNYLSSLSITRSGTFVNFAISLSESDLDAIAQQVEKAQNLSRNAPASPSSQRIRTMESPVPHRISE